MQFQQSSRWPVFSARSIPHILIAVGVLLSCGDHPLGHEDQADPQPEDRAFLSSKTAKQPLSSILHVEELLVEFPDKMAREPALIGDPAQLFLHSENGNLLADLVDQTWVFQNNPPATPPSPLVDGILQRAALPSLATKDSFASLRNGVLMEDHQQIGWAPDFATDTKGQVHLVYDRADFGNFNIYYRDPSGQTLAIAQSTRFEAHPSVLCDDNDRIWIAWDEGGEGWGQADGLHMERRLRLVVRENNVWKEVPLPPLKKLLAPPLIDADAPTASNAELPRLVFGANGELWMFFRVMRRFPSTTARKSARIVAWEIRAMVLGEDGWSDVITLPHSEGPNHDTLAVVTHADDGVLAVWTSDRRRERFSLNLEWHKRLMRNARVFSAHLSSNYLAPRVDCSKSWPVWKLPTNRRQTTTGPAWAVDPNPQLVPSGLQRLWGDLHRHSDISRCKMGEDGSVIDQFRYAISVADLDFLALTDHIQHMSWSVWGFEMAMSERFQLPQHFSTLFGFERAMPGGHRNLITADPEVALHGPFFQGTEQEALEHFSKLPVIAIPHQLSDRTALLHWDHHIPTLETLIEIFQGRRGSYEAADAPRLDLRSKKTAPHAIDFLEQGRRFGFIASSDHVSSGHAFAAVLAEENTREAIFDAMQKRRAYAATAKIALDVRLGELQMGEAGVVARNAPLHIRIDAGSPIARIDVIRSGELAHSWHGEIDSIQPWRRALLSVRLRGARGLTEVDLGGEDIRFESAFGYDNEWADSSSLTDDSTWPLRLSAVLESGDSDGWMIPILVRSGKEHPQVETRLDGDTTSWLLSEMDHGPRRQRLSDTLFSLEIHPTPLGEPTFITDWAPDDWHHGDWVYVRVMREDGAMAWSSPIWVED